MANPHVQHARTNHKAMLGAREKAAEYEAERDDAIRAAIQGDEENEPMTMYAIAKELRIPPQYVRRIRDRGTP